MSNQANCNLTEQRFFLRFTLIYTQLEAYFFPDGWAGVLCLSTRQQTKLSLNDRLVGWFHPTIDCMTR